MAMKQEKKLWQEGYDIGIGVASATGSPMALGAVGAITPPEVAPGWSGSFSFRRIDLNEDLEEELGVGAEVSGGIGLFSASASFNFCKKCKLQSSSLCVLISAEETSAFKQMDSPQLSPAASRLIEDGKTDRFSEQFGEYFIRGIRAGGRFFGLVRIDAENEQSKTDINAALSGSYGLAMDAEAKLNLSQTLKKSKSNVEAFMHYEGGRVTTHPTSNDPVELTSQLYKAMDEWKATIRSEPAPFMVTLAPYAIALGPNPPNIIEFEHQRDVLIRCAKLRARTIDMLNLVDYILDPKHMDEFVPTPNGPDLPTLQASLAEDLDVIAKAAAHAINNIKEAYEPESYMKVVKGKADFKLTTLPSNMPKHTGGVPPELPPTTPTPVESEEEIRKKLLDFVSKNATTPLAGRRKFP